jgi:hypothetical protein
MRYCAVDPIIEKARVLEPPIRGLVPPEARPSSVPIPVVHVAGNHEHYGSLRRRGGHLGGTIAELRAAAAASAGRVTFLERETSTVAGVRFVGCTLWTDYELFGDPAEDMAHAEIAMTDYETIACRPGVRFTTNDARREFMPAVGFLQAELAQPFDGPTVVITHHLPSLRSAGASTESAGTVAAARPRAARFQSEGYAWAVPAAGGPREIRRGPAKSRAAGIIAAYYAATSRRDRRGFGLIRHVSSWHSSAVAVADWLVRC